MRDPHRLPMSRPAAPRLWAPHARHGGARSRSCPRGHRLCHLPVAAYLYIAWLNPDWPLGARASRPVPGTVSAALVASAIPDAFADGLPGVRTSGGAAFSVLMSSSASPPACCAASNFTPLNVRWDDNAYGSLLWFVLGLHTTHLLCDVIDTLVLTALMFSKHAKGKRFSDIEDNGMFWNFVVVAWLPLYALLYWFPRIWGQ